MEDDLYDEFGNYIGPDLNMKDSDSDNQSVRSKLITNLPL